MPAVQSLVRLADGLIHASMQFWTQICRALAIAIFLCVLDCILSELAAGIRLELVRRGADVFQEILNLWEHSEGAVSLLQPALVPPEVRPELVQPVSVLCQLALRSFV